jgi:hemolysin D
VPPSQSADLTLRQFQSETDAIREAPVPLHPRLAIWFLAGLIVSCLTISVFVPVDRVVSSTSGTIVPTESVNVFQALDPSIIKSIDVREGQRVVAGQLLATLDQTFAAADVQQVKLQIASLDAQIERAEAELANRTPDFKQNDDPAHARYNALQQELFLQRAAQYKAQIESYNQKIDQTQATIAKLKNDEGRYSERESISKQIEQMRQTLMERQAGTLLNLLGATDQRLEMLRTLENDHNALIESQHQLASLNSDAEVFKQQWAATTSQELVTARNTRDGALSQLEKASKHQDLVRLTSSEDAVVLTVAKLSVGSVLKEGDSLMTLMPLRTPVEAEVHITTRDVGFLRTGDAATLKIDAFNAAEHGTAEGKVRWVSEGAFTTDDNGSPADPYYKARIAIDAFHFVGVPAHFRLIPGMTMGADIKVGQRSLARYVIGAALRGLGEAMREP